MIRKGKETLLLVPDTSLMLVILISTSTPRPGCAGVTAPESSMFWDLQVLACINRKGILMRYALNSSADHLEERQILERIVVPDRARHRLITQATG
jgi:hypothetical protein